MVDRIHGALADADAEVLVSNLDQEQAGALLQAFTDDDLDQHGDLDDLIDR